MKEYSNKCLAILSHELKTPVSNLNLLLETIYEYDETLSKYKKGELLELGLKEIERMESLINYFLYLGRDGNKSIVKHKTLFPTFIEGLDIVYEVLLLHRNSFLDVHIYNHNNCGYANIDKELYCHVILNLLANATKFTKQGKWKWVLMEIDILASVSLVSFSYNKYGRSSIIDSGVGFTDLVYISIKKNTLIYSHSGRFGLLGVKDIVLTHNLILHGISYPLRGAKLFFNMKLIQ